MNKHYTESVGLHEIGFLLLKGGWRTVSTLISSWHRFALAIALKHTCTTNPDSGSSQKLLRICCGGGVNAVNFKGQERAVRR